MVEVQQLNLCTVEIQPCYLPRHKNLLLTFDLLGLSKTIIFFFHWALQTYSSIETKLDANLCLSSIIIQSLLMILLRCRGRATLVASCARDTWNLASFESWNFQQFWRHSNVLFQPPLSHRLNHNMSLGVPYVYRFISLIYDLQKMSTSKFQSQNITG